MCYNESGGDQLEAFTEELEKEGKMTEDTKVLMKEITEKKPAENSAESSNIRVSDHWHPGNYSLYVGEPPCVFDCEPHGNLEVRGYEGSSWSTEAYLGSQIGRFYLHVKFSFQIKLHGYAYCKSKNYKVIEKLFICLGGERGSENFMVCKILEYVVFDISYIYM